MPEPDHLIARTEAIGLDPAPFLAAVERGNWREGLLLGRELRAAVERGETALAKAARAEGATWEALGEAAGTSRQSAHKRWAHLEPRKPWATRAK